MSTPSTYEPSLDLEEELDALTIEDRLYFYRATRLPKLHSLSAVQNLELTWLNLSALWVVDDATDVDSQREKVKLLGLLLEQVVQMRAQNCRTRLHEFLANVMTIIALTRAAEGELTDWWCTQLRAAAAVGGPQYDAFRLEFEPSTSRVYALLWKTREAARKQRRLEAGLENGERTADELRKDGCKPSVAVADPIELPHQGICCLLWITEEKPRRRD
ncbi:hypothetical protein AURDEDRAFT_171386 [Auricularia subglabra TFB-10046 SS5]|uniref:Uncharacterized protein n=1 Tax=Auricularia subglabra (strain TFB-10046 / SS5) TaxID=717982 RepID=J0WVY6_AURST|nr:hypothetical protein AURDEDRAFT_171386 [Auricularia subglabra TFB-10046 SS5]